MAPWSICAKPEMDATPIWPVSIRTRFSPRYGMILAWRRLSSRRVRESCHAAGNAPGGIGMGLGAGRGGHGSQARRALQQTGEGGQQLAVKVEIRLVEHQ